MDAASARRGRLARWPSDELRLRTCCCCTACTPCRVEERVREALDEVRPYLESHGGDVELLGVEDGVVRLRLQGSCRAARRRR